MEFKVYAGSFNIQTPSHSLIWSAIAVTLKQDKSYNNNQIVRLQIQESSSEGYRTNNTVSDVLTM